VRPAFTFPSAARYGSLNAEKGMGNTWVTDISHFDYRDDQVHELPAKALNLWGYFGAIIETALSKPPYSTSTGLPCRR